MGLFQFLLQILHFIIEIVKTVDLQVITDATAVGCDGLVVGDAIEAEELLQTSEFGIDEANCRLVSQPLFDILMIGFAALGGALSSNEDEVSRFPLRHPHHFGTILSDSQTRFVSLLFCLAVAVDKRLCVAGIVEDLLRTEETVQLYYSILHRV